MSTGPFWLALAFGICVTTLTTEVSGYDPVLHWTSRNLPKKKPHILHVIMDDLGWDDAPWMKNRYKEGPKNFYITKTLQDKDTRRERWLQFETYYTHPHPLQSRVAMYTGKYAYKLGLSLYDAFFVYKYSLPPDEKILPNYLKDIYYSTHMLGLWGMDSCETSDFNHTKRGYDTFYGFREENSDKLWDNDKLLEDVGQESITDLLTKRAKAIIREHRKSETYTWRPLYIHMSHQARHVSPIHPKCEKKCKKFSDGQRKLRCNMLCRVDKGLKQIMKAFEKAGYDENLLVVFSGHNTIAHENSLSEPDWLYSGGTPTPAFVYSKTLLSGKKKWKTKTTFHAASWLPTLLSAAGLCDKKIPEDIDGTNLWNETKEGENKKSKEFVVIDINNDDDNGAIMNNKEMLVRYNDTWEYYKLKRNKHVTELENTFEPDKRKFQKMQERCTCRDLSSQRGSNEK